MSENMNNVIAPLTSDETTFLYTVATKQLQTVIAKMFEAMQGEVADLKAELKDSLGVIEANVAKIRTDTQAAIEKVNTVPSPTEVLPDDAERWIRDMYSKAEVIATKQKTISGKILGRVYETMRSTYGVDIDNEYSKFRKVRSGSKLTMCSVTPSLRTHFESALLSVADCPTTSLPQSIVVRRMPREVAEMCLEIAPSAPPAVTFRLICKEMERRSGIGINKFINTQRPFMRYSKFAKSYFVYNSKTLRPIFESTVESMRG